MKMEQKLLVIAILFAQFLYGQADLNGQTEFNQAYDFPPNEDIHKSSVEVYSSEPIRKRPKFDEFTIIFLGVSLGVIATYSLLSYVISNWRGGDAFGINIGKSTEQKVLEFAENMEAATSYRLNDLSRLVTEAIQSIDSIYKYD